MQSEIHNSLAIGNRVIPGTASGFRFIIWSLICFDVGSFATQISFMSQNPYFKETEFVCELGDVFER